MARPALRSAMLPAEQGIYASRLSAIFPDLQGGIRAKLASATSGVPLVEDGFPVRQIGIAG